ncbi:MAG: hypothetical protein FWF77_05560 [Defluviitaleaceae bacterium]|nr:hypothetical protein [Defluviitaleaceae bacterium]
MICKKCGEVIGRSGLTCGACGTWNSQYGDVGEAPAPQAQDIHTDFSAEIKRHAKSVRFILGCLLITFGTFGAVFFDFTVQGIASVSTAMIHVVALWIVVYDAVFSPETSRKTLTALSMFKVSAVISLIFAVIVFGILGLAFLFATLSGFIFLFFFAIIGGVGYLVFRYYFLSLLRLLDALKERLTTGRYASLGEAEPFLIMSYIGIGVSVISAFFKHGGRFYPATSLCNRHEPKHRLVRRRNVFSAGAGDFPG